MLSLAIIAGLALAYRIRGHRPDGGVLRVIMHPVFTLRPLWAASCFGAVYALTGDVWIAGAVALGEWAGLHLRHAPGQDMGTWAGSVREDVAFMAIVGAQRGAVVLVLLTAAHLGGYVPFHPLWAVLPIGYALTLPLAYFVGWRVPFRVPPMLRGGIEWSELLTGATRAAVFLFLF
jgi:hypothetical protein